MLLLLVVSFFPARVSCFCPGWLGPSTSYLCLPGSGIIGTYDIYSFLSSLCLSKMQRVLHTCGFTQSGTMHQPLPPIPQELIVILRGNTLKIHAVIFLTINFSGKQFLPCCAVQSISLLSICLLQTLPS